MNNLFTFSLKHLKTFLLLLALLGLSISIDAVGIIQNESEKILIYPNPTTSYLRIESGELKIGNIDIFDVYGRKLLTSVPLNSTTDISPLPLGVYIVK